VLATLRVVSRTSVTPTVVIEQGQPRPPVRDPQIVGPGCPRCRDACLLVRPGGGRWERRQTSRHRQPHPRGSGTSSSATLRSWRSRRSGSWWLPCEAARCFRPASRRPFPASGGAANRSA